MRVLADSSAWIEHFRRGTQTSVGALMDEALERSELLTTGMVAAELLAGSSTDGAEELRRTLLGLEWIDLQPWDWFRVGSLSKELRAQGTPVHASDLQIAAAATTARVPLLTLDRGFLTIKQVLPELDLSVSALDERT